MLTDPCGKGKKLYSMVSQDLSITHQSFCMEDLVLSFPLQFSLCFQHFYLFQKHHTIQANLQSHSAGIFICSDSRGLWFTPYNKGWMQRQHLGDHPLRRSHKCFNSGGSSCFSSPNFCDVATSPKISNHIIKNWITNFHHIWTLILI